MDFDGFSSWVKAFQQKNPTSWRQALGLGSVRFFHPLSRSYTASGVGGWTRGTMVLPLRPHGGTTFVKPCWLVVEVSTPLKNMSESQLLLRFPIYLKVRVMFQSTNQNGRPSIFRTPSI